MNLKRYKEIWEHVLGIEYGSHYILRKNGQRIENEDTIISENLFNDYEVFLKV
jgi:hypothetical protein